VLVNKYWEKNIGWSQEEVTTHPNIFEAMYPDLHERETLLTHIQKGDTEWKTLRAVSRSGQAVEAKWANVVLSDGSTIGIGQLIQPPE
ncbi:MAG: hypothetical protein K8I82_23530, partial [Anaerolineae bacterium]|nr:hypothetical protein [Anaerolineae bacterium]